MKSGGFNLDVCIKFIGPRRRIFICGVIPFKTFDHFLLGVKEIGRPTLPMGLMSNEQNPLRLNGRARKTCAARSVLYKSVNHKGEMPYSCPTTHFPQQAEELYSNSRAYIINIL
jgi:hypothetical protein